jgi:hypothetical protein
MSKEKLNQKGRKKVKIMAGTMILACVPVAVAKANTVYPEGKLAEFVIEKMDVASFPSAIRPKLPKGEKTLGDHGYVTQKIDDREAVARAAQGSSELRLACWRKTRLGFTFASAAKPKDGTTATLERVYLLKAKNADGLLKGREASKEFEGCPVIGGAGEASGG